MKKFLKELRRRKVYGVAVAYIVIGWLLLQVAATLFPIFHAPEWVLQVFSIILFLGFPLALLLAWAYDLTPGGIKRATDTEADSPEDPEETAGALPESEASSQEPDQDRHKAPRVAVLPLKCQGGDAELEAFSDGLTEDITTGLSRFSYLMVISTNSARKFEGQSMDVRQVGQQLGARYVIEGKVRKGGATVRISIQLVDALTGTSLWADTFDREFEPAGMLDLQDQVSSRVVGTVADPNGVLVRSMIDLSKSDEPETLTPYEAVLRFFLYQQRISAEDHLPARLALERAVSLEPGYVDAWACLALIYLDEDRHMFNPQPDALDRALATARKAVDIDTSSQLAHFSLALVYYYRKDLGAFYSAADRAIAINPLDAYSMAMLGILYAYAGEWERGIELTNKAMQLNPHHPGWYRFASFFHAYQQSRYEEALDIAQKIDMPDYFASRYALAASHAQLGHVEAAREHAKEILRLYPDFETSLQHDHLDKWLYAQDGLSEHIIEGLKKAGLNMA